MKEISAFLSHLQYEKRFSVHTLTAYESDLSQLIEYLQKQYELSDITQATHFYIRSWIIALMDAGINNKSVNRKITVLRTFFRFLLREKKIAKNPMLKIQAPKTKKTLPVFVDAKKMDQVLDQMPDDKKEVPEYELSRNKNIIGLFYMTGMRLSELVNLKLSDVDFYNLSVTVLGKRNKVRQIPITLKHKRELSVYLEQRKSFLEEVSLQSEYLFLNNKGNKIYPKLVYRIVNKELKFATTNKKKSPHILRHSFATNMLNKGADINAIKELLGHSSLAATQVYTHNTIEKLKEIYKQAFPKA